MDPLNGAHLGKEYWVVDRIGDGGMGVVYVVEHRGLKKQFAAKILSRELTENVEARARFEIEARSASQLDHENIVNVTDYGVAPDGRPYLVMELLRGKTLFQRLSEGPMTLGECAAVVVPVCAALGAAHEAGIVHRDIKPENVFLAQRAAGRFHVKVLDFGIAKATVDTPRVTKLGQVLGSPLYMAPEACKGEDVDGRADIYSVGVLLYQLATGHLPFEDTNMLRLLQLHTSKPVPAPRLLNPEISPELEGVVLRALEKDRERRFQHVEELASAFLESLPAGADELLRAPKPTPPSRTPAPSGMGSGTPVRPGGTPMRSSQLGKPSAETPTAISVATPLQRPSQLTSPPAPASVPASSTVSMPSGQIKLDLGLAAKHAQLEGGPTLMAAPVSAASVPDLPSIVVSPPEGTLQTRAVAARRPTRHVLVAGVVVAAAAVLVVLLWPRHIAPATVTPPVAATTTTTTTPPPVATATPPAPAPTPPAAAIVPPAPARVRIHVTSTPAGVTVRLGGEELGVTPLALERDARAGSAPLELGQDGQWRTVREVALDKDVDLEIGLDATRGGKKPARVATPRPHRPATTPTPPRPTPPQALEIRGRR
jgi:serine/threonine-protein kinase